jgi:hypothetical protein
MIKNNSQKFCLLMVGMVLCAILFACAESTSTQAKVSTIDNTPKNQLQDTSAPAVPEAPTPPIPESAPDPAKQQLSKPNITEDYRANFDHGQKSSQYQKYIVLHDTEGDGDPASVISWWDGNGNMVAAHFVIGKDGAIYQCVPLDRITHHAGYGDIGHNTMYGITEDGRDDMRGTNPIGSSFPDYGMNAWSIGIEMVHIGGSGYYPQEQLDALDSLIAYIDEYYGFQSQIIDHKAWRSGNSDTSPEFAEYLSNYQQRRVHN